MTIGNLGLKNLKEIIKNRMIICWHKIASNQGKLSNAYI